jgi:hypothetical protein
MKKIILFGVLVYALLSLMPLHAQWARTYGTGPDISNDQIQQTSDGGYIVAGSIDYSDWGDNRMFWILKLNAKGEVEWERAYGGYGNHYIASIQQTSDGGYIVAGSIDGSFGANYYGIWILKLTSQGNIEWQRMYDGSGIDVIRSILQTSEGGYVAAGLISSRSSPQPDVLILKLSSAGDIEWQRTYGGSGIDECYSLQLTPDGGYVVLATTGSFRAAADFWVLRLSSNGDIIWQQTYIHGGSDWNEPSSIQLTNDGGYIVAGHTLSSNSKGSDFWVLKLSSNGDIEWQRAYDDLDLQTEDLPFMWGIGFLQLTSDGGYIVAGHTDISISAPHDTDSRILKLSSKGDIEWKRAFGGSGSDAISSIRQTSSGGYVAAGHTSSYGSGGEWKMIVLNLFPNGEIGPSCGLMTNLDVVVRDTNAIAQKTSISPKDIVLTTENTDVIPLSTSTSTAVNMLCEAPKPKVPKRLRAKALSSSEVRLKWKDKARYEEGFRLYRKRGRKKKWKKIADLKPNTKIYIDQGLKPKTLCQYRIMAFNVIGDSSYSNVAKATTKKKKKK